MSRLFLTDAEVAKRMGIETEAFKAQVTVLEREGFPLPDPLFQKRRYWPACQAFLDRRYGLIPSSFQSVPALDGEEQWN